MSLVQTQNCMADWLLKKDLREVDTGTSVEGLGNVQSLKLYQSLMRGTMVSVLTGIFPHTARFFSKQQWINIAQSYMTSIPVTDYQLYLAVEGFPEFLKSQLFNSLPSFLSELADYEWQESYVENALNSLTASDYNDQLPEDWLKCRPLWNPDSVLATYGFDIPKFIDWIKEQPKERKPLNLPEKLKESPSSVLIYRDLLSLKARYFQLSPITQYFIELSVTDPKLSVEEILLNLEGALNQQISESTLRNACKEFLISALKNTVLVKLES